jgi:hypothetical protein
LSSSPTAAPPPSSAASPPPSSATRLPPGKIPRPASQARPKRRKRSGLPRSSRRWRGCLVYTSMAGRGQDPRGCTWYAETKMEKYVSKFAREWGELNKRMFTRTYARRGCVSVRVIRTL